MYNLYIFNKMTINFTQADVEELQHFLDTEDDSPVFEWYIDGTRITITVGDDLD